MTDQPDNEDQPPEEDDNEDILEGNFRFAEVTTIIIEIKLTQAELDELSASVNRGLQRFYYFKHFNRLN